MKTEEEKFFLSQIVEKITSFLEERDWVKYHHPKEMATAAAVEYMELLEIFLDTSSFPLTDPKKLSDLHDEIGDVFFSLTSLYNTLQMDSFENLLFPPISPSPLSPLELLIHFGVKLGRLMEHFQWLREEESRSMKANAHLVSDYLAAYTAFRLFCQKVAVDPVSAALAKIEKTAIKYPPSAVSSDRENYVRWKEKLKRGV